MSITRTPTYAIIRKPSSPICNHHCLHHSTIRFLVSGSGTWATKLLGLTSSAIRNQQCSVVLHECLLQLVLRVFVDVFLVESDNRFCDSLPYGIDLRCMTTTGNSYSNVDASEFVKPNNQERLVDLESEDFWLDEGERFAIDFDEAFAFLAMGDCGCSFLLAEALHALCC